jgi:hypothetical protein
MEELTPINEIKERVEQDKALNINFNRNANLPSENTNKKPNDTATELVENAFNQAVMYQATTNENVQKDLLDSAEKVVTNKLGTIKSKAEQEDKESYFNNNKDAVACWGYSEKTVNKKFVKIMAFIFDIFTAIWITIGTFTFAPITYVAQKIKNIAKRTWVAFLLAIIIYLAIVGVPILTSVLIIK